MAFHYFIAVGVKTPFTAEPGKLFLKYVPIALSEEAVESIKKAELLSKDRVFETSIVDALKNFDCYSEAVTYSQMRAAARINNCTVHHFSTEFEIPDAEKYFDNMVDRANKYKYERNLLEESKI